MDKAKIIIKGEKVQEIGYRVSLLTNALNFGINNFYNYVKENIPEDAIVSDFEIENFTGNVMDIERYLHLIQVEQLNKGIPAILDIRDNTKKMLENAERFCRD